MEIKKLTKEEVVMKEALASKGTKYDEIKEAVLNLEPGEGFEISCADEKEAVTTRQVITNFISKQNLLIKATTKGKAVFVRRIEKLPGQN